MGDTGIAFFQRGLSSAREFVDLVEQLDRESALTHGIMTEAYTEAMTALAGAASATSRMQLGTGIVNIYWRHPYALAMQAANVSALSGRPFILGLGTGHQPVNVDGLGYDMSRPLRRMRDYIEVLRTCLSPDVAPDDFVEISNEHYRARQVRIGWTGDNISILLGALGEGMIRLAGEAADGVILSISPRQRIPRVRELMAEGAARSGRDPSALRLSAFINVVLRPTREEARQLLRGTVEGYLKLPYYARALAPYGFDLASGVTDEQVDSVGIAGPPEYAREWLSEYRAAGVDLPVLAPAGVFSLPPFESDATGTYRALAALAGTA
jgi:alkanesulfonate monooxygenase SsuD/methylene tetrahydromethanopterin reductase-like flavin-dependent oxidoreductase (luciferase family)